MFTMRRKRIIGLGRKKTVRIACGTARNTSQISLADATSYLEEMRSALPVGLKILLEVGIT